MRDAINIIELVVSLIIPDSLKIISTNHITEYVIKIPYIIVMPLFLDYTYSIQLIINLSIENAKKYPS